MHCPITARFSPHPSSWSATKGCAVARLILGISHPLRVPSRRVIYSKPNKARRLGFTDGRRGYERGRGPEGGTHLDLLSRHKAGIVMLLRPAEDSWSAKDWRGFFDERARIAEFDGGLLRADAEVRAFAYCIVEWLNRNPVCSPPGRCFGCGGGEHT
jgi:hypothetical protein